MAPTPIEVEAYDSDHETSDQVTTEPRRTTRTRTASEWYGDPVLKVMLLDNNEPTSYGEAMVVMTPTQCHIDLACNTSYRFAASRTVSPRVSLYLCPGPFAHFGTRI